MKNLAKINSFFTICKLMLKGILYRKLIARKIQNKGETKLFLHDPLHVAKLRYARGEITKKQFRAIKKEILHSQIKEQCFASFLYLKNQAKTSERKKFKFFNPNFSLRL